jgi:hypothetical protein
MGWTVLYIAFGFVALWLLAEVLLQNKARLRWRVLAFAGFLGVVAGVLLPSVIVIGIGATAFAVGQTLVTLSFRRGFEAGWSVGKKKPAAPKRRSGRPAREEPALEVSGLEAIEPVEVAGPPAHGDPGETSAFASPFADPAADAPYGDQSGYAYAGGAAQDPGYAYSGYYDPQAPADGAPQDAYAQGGQSGYDYGTGEHPSYAAYADPYGGAGAQPPGSQDQTGYPGYGAQYHGTGQEGYQNPQDPYTSHHYAMDTPPGGVWVPAQRGTEQPYPEQQAYPYQQPQGGYPAQDPAAGQPAAPGYDTPTGEYEQYRY